MDVPTNPPTVIVVRSGRNPHAVSLALGLVLISVYGLLFSTPSVSLDSGLTQLQRILFGLCSFAGTGLIIAGVYWKRILPGLQIERTGHLLLSTGCAVYVITLCFTSSFDRSGLITSVGISIFAAGLWRIGQIRDDLRLLRGGAQR